MDHALGTSQRQIGETGRPTGPPDELGRWGTDKWAHVSGKPEEAKGWVS